MTHTDLLALLPLLITGYFGILLMLFTAFKPGNRAAFILTLVGLSAALISVVFSFRCTPHTINAFFVIDGLSLYFIGLALASGILTALISYEYLAAHVRHAEAFYLLLLMAVLGMEAVVSSAHFIAFFLGVETLSISLYGLIGYTRDNRLSLEASIKYLILTAASSAFLLFGIAIIYSDTGTMNIPSLIPAMGGSISVTSLFGLAMIMVFIGFKLAIAPFHQWSPDVYQGAPAPTTALIATGSKGAVLAFLLRLVVEMKLNLNHNAFIVLAVLAVATMFTGNLLALNQRNIKRLLAYSSISQIGYLLIPLIASYYDRSTSIAFYLTSYFATTLAAFGVISVVSSSRRLGDAEEIDSYRGLYQRHPALAAILALALISLIGIPPTAGFFAKLFIFLTAAHERRLWWLLIVAVVNSGISAFYYLRVIAAVYSNEEAEPLPGPKTAAAIALAISTAAIIFFGIYPPPLIRIVEFVLRK